MTPAEPDTVSSINKIMRGGNAGRKVLRLPVRVGDRVVIQVSPGAKYRKKPLKLTITQADGTVSEKHRLSKAQGFEVEVTAAGELRIELRKLRKNGRVHLRADVLSG